MGGTHGPKTQKTPQKNPRAVYIVSLVLLLWKLQRDTLCFFFFFFFFFFFLGGR